MKILLWCICGLVFGVGLGISGMTQPEKVVGFLNVWGGWDPSLALVMVGAIGVHVVGHMLRARLPSPLAAESFQIPTRNDISVRLLCGAALFGLGWGLAGYCPGPAIVSVGGALAGGGTLVAIYFTAAMVAGMVLFRLLMPSENRPQNAGEKLAS